MNKSMFLVIGLVVAISFLFLLKTDKSQEASTPRTEMVSEEIRRSVEVALQQENSISVRNQRREPEYPLSNENAELNTDPLRIALSNENENLFSDLSPIEIRRIENENRQRAESYQELVEITYRAYFDRVDIDEQVKENILSELIAADDIRQELQYDYLAGKISQREMAMGFSEISSPNVVGKYLENAELLDFLRWELDEIL